MTVTARGGTVDFGGRSARANFTESWAQSRRPQLIANIVALAGSRSTILIVGESGSGKELVARAIHHLASPHAPFVALNCAALPKDLIESELFGYVKGAFSGAGQDQLGLFRSAQGGTLFLDEITEMNPETQAKLLRAIQERSVRPVGAMREVPVDVRILASTNRDPAQAVRDGQLRKDLYYRLAVGVIEAAPLRERTRGPCAAVEAFRRALQSAICSAAQSQGRRDRGVRPTEPPLVARKCSRACQCDRGRDEFHHRRHPEARGFCAAGKYLVGTALGAARQARC